MPVKTIARAAAVRPAPLVPAREVRPLRPLLLALFVGSGCAALIYEIVWFQLLQLVIGSSAISLAVLLGTFMGGMCLGSLAFPRFVSPRHHPLAVYGLLELGTGVLGLLALVGIPYVNYLYVAGIGHGMPSVMLRAVVCAACLLPPTLLMGATLPAISRYVQTTPDGVSWMGWFYGGNIAGAVCGSLLAGFYLLRVYDMSVATYVAVGIDFLVGALGLLIAKFAAYSSSESDRAGLDLSGPRMIYIVIALSGFTGLGAEVVWTRLLSLMLGGTVYTFSIILAVFLIGLGIGSSVGSLIARTTPRPRMLLGLCQLALAGAIFWTAYMLTESLPFWPINPSLSWNIWFNFQLDLMRCVWAIFPGTVLWGASFPLALAAVARRGQDAGRLVGGVYAANTLGAILGSVLLSMVVIPWRGPEGHGTQDAQRLLIAVAALSATLALAPMLFSSLGRPVRKRVLFSRLGWTCALAVLLCTVPILMFHVVEVPGELVAWGRNLMINTGTHMLYVGEGMNSSVAVTGQKDGDRYFHVAGKVEASSEPQDMRLQRMLGHLPALLHPDARRVLVVGCGAGVTAGSFLVHPQLEHETICEIEPLIPRVVSTYFSAENYDVVHDPRVHVVFDDARHYVLTTDQTYDIITSDPINPWVKGAATLYTREYFELCKRHLAPGGFVTQWVPLYESNSDAVKSQIATFFQVFPNGTIWSNDQSGKGYDIVLLGQSEVLKIDVEALAERLGRDDHARVKRSLKQVGFTSAVDLLGTYGGRSRDMAGWLANSQINRDRNLRLQYLAGMDPNTYNEAAIYNVICDYRKFPDDLFAGNAITMAALRASFIKHGSGSALP
ncbi:MAG TPA: fused MFS/spermidine synthase [Tepidisphaeraceae bacterium]|nr:fused MFS/spermidine synthase [Tepidisphaeraceae bacterium]